MMMLHIRRIRADEGPRLRALRLRALAEAPMAFGSSLLMSRVLQTTSGAKGPSAHRWAAIVQRLSRSATINGSVWRLALLA